MNFSAYKSISLDALNNLGIFKLFSSCFELLPSLALPLRIFPASGASPILMALLEFHPVERLQSNVTPNNLRRAIPEELLLMKSYQIRAPLPRSGQMGEFG